MAELLDILDAFSMPLKVGWVIWMAWGIGQIFWFRYERRPQAARARAKAARKPFQNRCCRRSRRLRSQHHRQPMAPVGSASWMNSSPALR